MPPERKVSVPDATTVEDLMGDGPGPGAEDPQALFMEAIQNDNNPYPEGEGPEEVDDHAEEVQVPTGRQREEAPAVPDPDGQEDEGQEAEGEVEEDVVVSRDAYERILSMLGLDDEDLKSAQTPAKEEALEEAKPEPLKPPTKPLSESQFKLPETYDDLIEMQSDPEKYAAHMNAMIQNAVEKTVAAMEPIINERASYIYQAIEFDKRFFEKHPEVPVKLAIKGLATAQKNLGPNASWDDLFVETEKNCAFAMNVAQSMKRADSRTRDRVGRNAPKTTRRSRPTLNGAQVSPTEEVLANITSPGDYDRDTIQLLRDVGTM